MPCCKTKRILPFSTFLSKPIKSRYLAAPNLGGSKGKLAANLPLDPPKLGAAKYLDLMGLDKKVENGKIRLVLQQGIGRAVITSDYDADKLNACLSAY